jgi:L-glyceraldehyde 3-phosphate reductase
MPTYLAADDRYEPMPYRRSGRSGLKLPAISLGLWHNFGGVDTVENARAILRRAFDLGITHFDLANNYGPPPGSAELTFGQIFKQDFLPYRDELIISTKAGYWMWEGPYGEWGSRKYLVASLDQSLKRMGLDYVDIFYHHRPDPDTPLEETMAALDHIVRQGKALYVGISNYNADQTRQAARLLREMGTPCVINQVAYSMFRRWVEPELIDAAGEMGVGLIFFSPLAQGLLTDRYLGGIPEGSRASKTGTFLKKDQVTDDLIAHQRGQTLAQMALAWVLRHPGATSALIGASSVQQIDDNCATVKKLDFSSEELQAIDAILA